MDLGSRGGFWSQERSQGAGQCQNTPRKSLRTKYSTQITPRVLADPSRAMADARLEELKRAERWGRRRDPRARRHGSAQPRSRRRGLGRHGAKHCSGRDRARSPHGLPPGMGLETIARLFEGQKQDSTERTLSDKQKRLFYVFRPTARKPGAARWAPRGVPSRRLPRAYRRRHRRRARPCPR